ncbi:hypothetical protein LTR56_021349 [Elasticomyces elasticus]|nr:hypothetical protein LTR56_021349 [Elasticomyces elasticus]KAK3631690.1 hypothetical protein LTR22_020980 [Elasticomyces elasticus]KAK4909551.1 hypothetical protein LTR49_021668 [Elasticomyces elasticus]
MVHQKHFASRPWDPASVRARRSAAQLNLSPVQRAPQATRRLTIHPPRQPLHQDSTAEPPSPRRSARVSRTEAAVVDQDTEDEQSEDADDQIEEPPVSEQETRKYTSTKRAERAVQIAQNLFKCPVLGCKHPGFLDRGGLHYHLKKVDHSKEQFICPIPGCERPLRHTEYAHLLNPTSHTDVEVKTYAEDSIWQSRRVKGRNRVRKEPKQGIKKKEVANEMTENSQDARLNAYREEMSVLDPRGDVDSDDVPKKKVRGKAKKAKANASPIDEESITVVQKPGYSEEDSPLSEVAEGFLEGASIAVASKPKATWRSKGKKPMYAAPDPNDVIMIETDGPEDDYVHEEVDEGYINYGDHTKSEHELGLEEDYDLEIINLENDDTDDESAPVADHLKKSHMRMIAKNEYALSHTPWKVMGVDIETRKVLETMYGEKLNFPLGGSWESSEAYMMNQDKEMLRYMIDYPLKDWVINPAHAQETFRKVLERTKYRDLGAKVYAAQMQPEMIPQSTPSSFMHGPQGHPMGPPQYQHGPPPPPQAYGSPYGHPSSMQYQQQMRPPQGQPMQPPQGQPMPPPPHVLPSQQHAMPNGPPNGYPPNGYPASHQYPHPQRLMGPPPAPFPVPQFGQPGIPHHPQQQQMVYHGAPMQQQQPMHPQQQMQPMQPMQPYPNMPVPAQSMSPDHDQRMSGGRMKKVKDLPPGPTPPYAVRERPAERKKFNKTGKRNLRKQAEAEEFPWHRQIDFDSLKAVPEALRWDISEYDQNVLNEMVKVRTSNIPLINKIDADLADKQKKSRSRKHATERGMELTGQDAADNESDNGGRLVTKEKKEANVGGDPYYSGNFSFVSDADRLRARALGYKTPDDLLDAAEQVTDPVQRAALRMACKETMICWNPGKKGLTETLTQAIFRAYDTLITREQYDNCLILTKRAAECIVDFCPDLLWRETLLRIVAEAGYGNTEIRNRICYNGCYADKATITKRIAAALGQKQQNPPRKYKTTDENGAPGSSKSRRGAEAGEKGRYFDGEEDWHNGNKFDFDDYQRYFGVRVGNTYVRRPRTGGKRKASGGDEMDVQQGGAGAGNGVGSSHGAKRAKTEETTTSRSSEVRSEMGSPEAEGGAEEQEAEEDDGDAVSVQSDGVLDEIED